MTRRAISSKIPVLIGVVPKRGYMATHFLAGVCLMRAVQKRAETRCQADGRGWKGGGVGGVGGSVSEGRLNAE